MLTRLKAEFHREGLDLTKLPLAMDSWCVSQPLRQRRHDLGFTKISIAGKSNYTFTIDGTKQDAAPWKKDLVLRHPTWGIAVPSCRVQGRRPTFGAITRFCFQKSTTRSYYLMHFSRVSMRGAAIWPMWKPQHLGECCWTMRKAILPIRARQLQGNGLYTAWLSKGFAYVLALRLQAQRPFSKLSITQIMRKLSRDHDLKDMLTTHFHLPILAM
jgi:hypothetical protein